MAPTNAHQQRQSIPTTALATQAPNTTALGRWGMDRDQLDLLKRTLAKGTTDDEFALFMNTAQRLGLDPFAKQIYAVKRWDNKEKREVMAIQVGIDGFRAVAARSNTDDGQEGPFWCGADGVWHDVWLGEGPPCAAKVVVWKKGSARPYVGIATYRSYVQTRQDGSPNSMWSRGADFMLAKCAEAVALRKAHPAELGGVLAPEELDDEADIAAVTMQKLPDVAVVTAPPTAAKPANTSSTSAPTKPDKPAAPEMTEEEANEIEKEIVKCTTKAQVQEIMRKKIAPRAMSQAIRDRLAQVCIDHMKLIAEAAKAEREAAGETTTEGAPQP